MLNWKTLKLRKLSQAIITLKEEKQLLAFLRDLCTPEELEALSSRWEVVELLDKGISYREIAEKTGVSTATITRIAHWLTNGEGGYTKALENLKKTTKKSRP